jgi:hypothetical protein
MEPIDAVTSKYERGKRGGLDVAGVVVSTAGCLGPWEEPVQLAGLPAFAGPPALWAGFN